MWLLGTCGGVLVRAAILGHWRASELAFLAVSLAFLGAVAGALLLAATLLTRRLATRHAPAGQGR